MFPRHFHHMPFASFSRFFEDGLEVHVLAAATSEMYFAQYRGDRD
jgi:hypothetical protein